MASIKFNLLTKGNPSNLNIRFYHGRKIDCNAQSHILIDPKLWSNKLQNLKPLADTKTKEEYRERIQDLKDEIIRCFNRDYAKGLIIDSKWLSKAIDTYYKRPLGEDDYTNFFVPFIEKYTEDSENRLNLVTGKKISFRTIQKYKTTGKQIEDFEAEYKVRLKITDINLDFHKKFTSHLKLKHKYSNTSVEKSIRQIKSFVREAKEMGYEVSSEIESRKFTFQKDETVDTYLNETEIDLIYNLDLSDNESLDNVRDLFVIGLWTGLRISDLKRINQFHFSDNTIVISETEKTGSTVEIPIHPQVREILKKRNNKLPRIISDQKFNKYVKDVCQEAKINEMILGSVRKKKTNRKEKGYYPKHELISSHTARRSFATNHYGKIDDRTIMAITTHKSHSQFMKYIKTTQKEHIDKLAKYWEEQEELKNAKPVLKVVN